MIDVDYNEYKKTIAENMKLIVENNRLKEVEKEHQKLNGELREEIEKLKEELEVAKTNEETYRLEMLDITKRLGLNEETLFDDVKDKAERLNNILNESADEILKELEENNHLSYGVALAIRQKLIDYRELKGSDK